MPPKEPARLAVGLEVEGPPPENAPDSPRAAVSRVLGPPLRAIERADLAQEKVTLGSASSQRRASDVRRAAGVENRRSSAYHRRNFELDSEVSHAPRSPSARPVVRHRRPGLAAGAEQGHRAHREPRRRRHSCDPGVARGRRAAVYRVAPRELRRLAPGATGDADLDALREYGAGPSRQAAGRRAHAADLLQRADRRGDVRAGPGPLLRVRQGRRRQRVRAALSLRRGRRPHHAAHRRRPLAERRRRRGAPRATAWPTARPAATAPTAIST